VHIFDASTYAYLKYCIVFFYLPSISIFFHSRHTYCISCNCDLW